MRFLIYVFRWIVSAIIMTPIMILLEPYLSLIPNLFITQIIGACIFYNIDKWIFKGEQK